MSKVVSRGFSRSVLLAVVAIWTAAEPVAQNAPQEPPRGQPGVPGDPGRPPGGPGGPMAEERKLVSQFDADGSGRLDAAERAKAREFLRENPTPRRGPGGGREPGGQTPEPATPGARLSTEDVEHFPDSDLYDTTILRTIFLDFESSDWEAELADFYNSDVEVPASLTVDGVVYREVGVHFRGASSFFMVPAGRKRSLNVSLDFADADQRLYGKKTLNLLNSHGDPSFMSTVLYSHMARAHIPAPRANFVRVVINGECWGVYVSVEQFNREFLEDHYDTSKGARWKVKGSPGGVSGLDYVGEDIEQYRRRYEIKSADTEEDWAALIELCRTLSTTPLESLEEALTPILDIEGALWFLAFDATLVNSDGYWVRASDYSIYRDEGGVFHLIPHDMNESFSGTTGGPGMGRGRRGGPPGVAPVGGQAPGGIDGGPPPPPPGGGAGAPERPAGLPGAPPVGPGSGPPGAGGPPGGPGGEPRRPGYELDPLVGMNDLQKPLRSRLLAVPRLRERYLECVRQIATESLDWTNLGPIVAAHRALIAEAVRADTRKSSSFEAFELATADEVAPPTANTPSPGTPLRLFADRRREYLLKYVPPALPPGDGNGGAEAGTPR